MSKPIGLFDAYGIEIELMIVEKTSLNVSSSADLLLTAAAGKLVSDFEDGPITWSNELVNHVLEFKTTGPAKSLIPLEMQFFESQQHASRLLNAMGLRLMPTGMHPWMNPLTETQLWAHDNNEIYDLYNKIFDCRGHGWSNLQSVHINLPFANESEFNRLHSAVRLILPLIPALSASSPFADGQASGQLDSRLAFYETNQSRFPVIAGEIIPDSVSGFDDYRNKITNPIQRSISPYDPDGILVGDWLNSRGAIARIDRGTIEIRLLDTQECAHADLILVQFVTTLVQAVCERADLLEKSDRLTTNRLHAIYQSCVRSAENAPIYDAAFLSAFALNQPLSTHALLRHLLSDLVEPFLNKRENTAVARTLIRSFNEALGAKSLATRILQAVRSRTGSSTAPSRAHLMSVYGDLCLCLDENRVFTSSVSREVLTSNVSLKTE